MVNRCQTPHYPEYYVPHSKRSCFASVAIIIVGFNGAFFLPSCLDSVLCQSHPADEIVFVDDGSTDDSINVVKRWGRGKVKIVSLPENQGMCAARNAGVDATQSTLLL
jgi:glycosyltransferase involved in cell wall biosynthesis